MNLYWVGVSASACFYIWLGISELRDREYLKGLFSMSFGATLLGVAVVADYLANAAASAFPLPLTLIP